MDDRDDELDPALGDLNPDMWINVMEALTRAGMRNTMRRKGVAARGSKVVGPFRVDDLTLDLLEQLAGAMRIARVDVVTIALWLLGDAMRPVIEEYNQRVSKVLLDQSEAAN